MQLYLPFDDAGFSGQQQDGSFAEGVAVPSIQSQLTLSARAIRGRLDPGKREAACLQTEEKPGEQHLNKIGANGTSIEQATSYPKPIGSGRPKATLPIQQQRKKHGDQMPGERKHDDQKQQQQGQSVSQKLECSFCRRLGERDSYTRTHVLRDPVTNVVVCPILRKHHCEICGATGDNSHTRSYCPNKPKGTYNMALLKNTPRNSTGKRTNICYVQHQRYFENDCPWPRTTIHECKLPTSRPVQLACENNRCVKATACCCLE
ncbi:uncharacterized protein LOC144107684 [Amblyomma americanum]